MNIHYLQYYCDDRSRRKSGAHRALLNSLSGTQSNTRQENRSN